MSERAKFQLLHAKSGFALLAAAAIALLALIPAPAIAGSAQDAEPCALSAPERHIVAEVKDGETLTLTDGTVVRLIGAKAPAAPLSFRGDHPWPLVAEAREALAGLAQGVEVELRFGGTRSDRHGRMLAQVFAIKGDRSVWLQGELIAKGLARVYSFPDNHACVGALLAREAEARAKRLGVWGNSAYRILDAENVERLSRLTRSYQLVEGVVAAVGEGKSRLYLNFAKDWRSDFTVALARKDSDAFKAEGLDVNSLAGKRLRVRGWIEWRNGPMIEVTHLEQIEVLGGAGAPATKEQETPPNGMAL
jgi:endonuclease YncB( thermonuclease family)